MSFQNCSVNSVTLRLVALRQELDHVTRFSHAVVALRSLYHNAGSFTQSAQMEVLWVFLGDCHHACQDRVQLSAYPLGRRVGC